MHTPKQALIVRGGWEGHDPIGTTEEFLPFLASAGYEVQIQESTAVYADAHYMASVDVIIQNNTMNTIEKEELAGLMSAVKAGTGLAGWHGGIADSYRNSSDYLQLIGGQFAHHPPRFGPAEPQPEGAARNYLPHTINIVAEHPIVAGIEDFELTTEQYWVLSDDYNDVLATTTLAARDFDPWHRPVTCPAVWTRRWGQGKIMVCTPGHSLDIVQHPSVRTIIERGIVWATR